MFALRRTFSRQAGRSKPQAREGSGRDKPGLPVSPVNIKTCLHYPQAVHQIIPFPDSFFKIPVQTPPEPALTLACSPKG